MEKTFLKESREGMKRGIRSSIFEEINIYQINSQVLKVIFSKKFTYYIAIGMYKYQEAPG